MRDDRPITTAEDGRAMTCDLDLLPVIDEMNRLHSENIRLMAALKEIWCCKPDDEVVGQLLRLAWDELQNGANEALMSGALGYLRAFYDLGLLNRLEWEGWQERFKRCPDPTHGGGRGWCAYCGTIPDEKLA